LSQVGFFQQAVELGITFWDTANVYQAGSSEEFVGRAIKKYARREEIVIATKVSGKMHDGPGGSGLSRAAIMEQVDASLRRLDTDYIDVYLIHRFDPDTPVEETMKALHDLVKSGKVRYLGASSMNAWQFAKMQHAADLHGWTRFVAMQDQYNLIKREEEREMLPMCADMGVGCVQYSPQGKGAGSPAPGHTDRSVGRRCGGEILRPGCRPAGRGRGPARCRVAGHPDVEGRAGLAAAQARRIGADRRSHQAAPPRGRRGRGRGHLDRGRDPTARGAVQTAGSLPVVKRAAPAARKSRQEFSVTVSV
jgi:hypothetical protein